MVRRLLGESEALVFNLDKCGYASDLTSIEQVLHELGPRGQSRHQLLRVDLCDAEATTAAVRAADPDLVLHLAAESQVDRSIEGPAAFIDSNVTGTFNLLQAVRAHWQGLPAERQARFRLHQFSTDEVFGSLGPTGRFSESTPYDPRSPYSASKAASDHLVNAWHHTYGLPVVLTNGSNNYGPWQFPEKLIPVVMLKAEAGEPIVTSWADNLSLLLKEGLAATVRWFLEHREWCQPGARSGWAWQRPAGSAGRDGDELIPASALIDVSRRRERGGTPFQCVCGARQRRFSCGGCSGTAGIHTQAQPLTS